MKDERKYKIIGAGRESGQWSGVWSRRTERKGRTVVGGQWSGCREKIGGKDEI